MVNRLILKTFGVACISALITAIPMGAQAASGVLETPAMKSDLAATGLLTDVARAGKRLIAVGERGHIIFSDDEGASWTQASVPVSTTLTGVYFSSPQQGWAVGHGAVVLHTADAGATWEKQFDGKAASVLVIQSLNNEIAALEAQVDAAPENQQEALATKLDDLRFTLEDTQADADIGPWKPLLSVWFADDQLGYVAGAYGYLFRTTDGGKSWQDWSVKIPNPDKFHLNAIGAVTGGAVFIAGEAGNIFLSTDAGESWKSVESPYDGSLFGLTGTGNVNEALVFGLRGHIFRSTNLGKSWQTVSTDGESTLNDAASGGNGLITLVGNEGVVLVSTNNGETFRVQYREDRENMVSAAVLAQDHLLLIGERGAVRADLKAKDL